jgi:hypothetical protein
MSYYIPPFFEKLNKIEYASWCRFFRDALIPDQFVHVYASKFVENRIRFDMLADIDKNLLNEMGIVAIGDCLSILKHAKATFTKVSDAHALQNKTNKHLQFWTIFSKMKTEKNEKEASPSFHNFSLTTDSGRSSPLTINTQSPKKTLVAKRIIDRLINDSDCKSTASTVTTSNNHHTSSTLSADLLTRLSFSNSNNSQAAPQGQVVRFNKDSLGDTQSSKVIVSSTTCDDLDESENPFGTKKIISLKRKSADSERKAEKPLEYMGTLKTDGNQSGTATSGGRTLSLNDRIKITHTSGSSLSKLSGITVTMASAGAALDTGKGKGARLAMDEELEPLGGKQHGKTSVFNRIKTVNNKSEDVTRSEEKLPSKVILLNKSKPVMTSEANGAKKIKSIHARLSFK